MYTSLYRSCLLGVVFALLAVSACGNAAERPYTPREARAVIANASDGEIFALESGLSRIRQPGLILLARARLAAAHLDAESAQRLVDQYFALDERTPGDDARAWTIVTAAWFAAGDYAKAALAGEKCLQAVTRSGNAKDKLGAAQTLTLARELARWPGQRVVSYVPSAIRLLRDKVGLPRVHVTVNGVDQEAVFDTGANLSVVSVSTARKLHLRFRGGAGGLGVGGAARSDVPVRVGVAREFRFAGLVLSDVPFLVLEDKQLEMPVPGGYRIDAILGFPVLRALQTFKVTRDRLIPARSASDGQGVSGNLAMVGNDVFVQARVDGIPVGMLLDSGAKASSLSSRFACTHPEVTKGLVTRDAHVAGAGGATVVRFAKWPRVRFDVGGGKTTVPGLAVSLADAGGNSANTLGEDILGRFQWWSVDFDHARFEVGPVEPPGPQGSRPKQSRNRRTGADSTGAPRE